MARPKKVEVGTETQPAGETPLEVVTEQPILVTAQAKTYVTVTPVYGAMHHPFQNIRIEGETPVEMDNWVEVQVAAGKLTVQEP